MEHTEQLGDWAAAMAKAQPKFEAIKKDIDVNTGKFGYSYADLAQVVEKIKAALSEAEIAYTQPGSVGPDGIVIHTFLIHSSGQWMRSDLPLLVPADIRPQDFGSAMTYMRRYGLCAAVGVAPEADDDDAQRAQEQGPAPIRRGIRKAKEADKKDTSEVANEIMESYRNCKTIADIQRVQTARGRQLEWFRDNHPGIYDEIGAVYAESVARVESPSHEDQSQDETGDVDATGRNISDSPEDRQEPSTDAAE